MSLKHLFLKLVSLHEGKRCPEGWERFGCSCYFKSNEKKTWSDSRWDCQSRGSDLVIINNVEEQEFVVELVKSMNCGDSWIGLRVIQENKPTRWEWVWVDHSLLTEKFWAAGSPHQQRNQYPAACCDQQGKWTQSIYSDHKNWICEKNISCFP
ncbi:C-type lectin domain family 4 member M-like [Micropterus salmoides]|uniref:C-type lectin domain family 4 member M-like n=1 Tax=Micropterus salmoides TaxID=27706 RepID=UPI0018EDC503|nr:C-type lectin domain family 4 member M-like [Micropterus salmoides]XP_038580085.1 C-type lectin domain family 4 member M-like [Micropterus salmoides]XP_038580086.1 C-type lectin domain family 4 member M-like [Micropterus salmoides]